MVQDLKKELTLKDYANKYDIDELSSEDIIKLMERPYLIEEITSAFDITEKEFNDIKKQKGISNLILENTIRNIDTILYYIYDRNKFISNKTMEKVLDMLIFIFINKVPKEEFYRKKLSKIDFSRENVIHDLLSKKVDINYRLKDLSDIIKYINKMVEILETWEEMDIYKEDKIKLGVLDRLQ